MGGPCLCGDPACPSCGPAQGVYGDETAYDNSLERWLSVPKFAQLHQACDEAGMVTELEEALRFMYESGMADAVPEEEPPLVMGIMCVSCYAVHMDMDAKAGDPCPSCTKTSTVQMAAGSSKTRTVESFQTQQVQMGAAAFTAAQVQVYAEKYLVKGTWVCDKCDFQLSKRVIDVQSGNVGINIADEAEVCPNDGTLLRQGTLDDVVEGLERVIQTLEARLEKLTTQGYPNEENH